VRSFPAALSIISTLCAGIYTRCLLSGGKSDCDPEALHATNVAAIETDLVRHGLSCSR
jgi:hypothetical protein